MKPAGSFSDRTYRAVLAALLLLLAAALPGCGGGGGNGTVSDAGDNVISDIRAELLDAVNAARSSARSCGGETVGPSPPVSWSDALATAAWLHSSDMAENGFFSHTGSDGSSPGDRIERQGYDWRTYGENVAVGYGTVSAVIEAWLGSAGHCRNIMGASFTEIGAGYAAGPYGGNPSARFWTLDLAD